jgi:hypothetical protein
MREICCPVCGNEIESSYGRCPFCASGLKEVLAAQGGEPHKIINLKRNMPLVEEALARLERELIQARLERRRVLTLIHGYGSTGAGGVIREEVRARLHYLLYQGHVKEIVCGEDFSSRSGPSRNLLRSFPALRRHRDLNRRNPGITLVVL